MALINHFHVIAYRLNTGKKRQWLFPIFELRRKVNWKETPRIVLWRRASEIHCEELGLPLQIASVFHASKTTCLPYSPERSEVFIDWSSRLVSCLRVSSLERKYSSRGVPPRNDLAWSGCPDTRCWLRFAFCLKKERYKYITDVHQKPVDSTFIFVFVGKTSQSSYFSLHYLICPICWQLIERLSNTVRSLSVLAASICAPCSMNSPIPSSQSSNKAEEDNDILH